MSAHVWMFLCVPVYWPGVCMLSECLCCLCRTVTSGSNTSTSYAPTWAFTSDTSSSCANGVAKTSTWNSILMSTWKHTQVRKMYNFGFLSAPIVFQTDLLCQCSCGLLFQSFLNPGTSGIFAGSEEHNLHCDCRNLILVLNPLCRKLWT